MADKISFDDYLKSDNIAVQEVTAQDIFVDTPRKFDFTVLFLFIIAAVCVCLTYFYYANSYVPINDKVDIGYVSAGDSITSNKAQSDKININTADIDALCTLSGIGEGKALNIVAYRSANGDFKSVEDIKNVSGIGEAIYEKIKDKICI